MGSLPSPLSECVWVSRDRKTAIWRRSIVQDWRVFLMTTWKKREGEHFFQLWIFSKQNIIFLRFSFVCHEKRKMKISSFSARVVTSTVARVCGKLLRICVRLGWYEIIVRWSKIRKLTNIELMWFASVFKAEEHAFLRRTHSRRWSCWVSKKQIGGRSNWFASSTTSIRSLESFRVWHCMLSSNRHNKE